MGTVHVDGRVHPSPGEPGGYRANINNLHNTNFGVGCFEFYSCKKILRHHSEKMFYFCDFFLWNSVSRSYFWLTRSNFFYFCVYFLCLASFFGGVSVSFILVPLKRTWGTLGLARHL